MNHLVASIYDIFSGLLFDDGVFKEKAEKAARDVSTGKFPGMGQQLTDMWYRASTGDHHAVLDILAGYPNLDIGEIVEEALVKSHVFNASVLWRQCRDANCSQTFFAEVCKKKRALETLTEVLSTSEDAMTRVRSIRLAAMASGGRLANVRSLLSGHVSRGPVVYGFALSMAIRHSREDIVMLMMEERQDYDLSTNFGMHLVQAATQMNENIFLAILEDPQTNVAEYGSSAVMSAQFSGLLGYVDMIVGHENWDHKWDSEVAVIKSVY